MSRWKKHRDEPPGPDLFSIGQARAERDEETPPKEPAAEDEEAGGQEGAADDTAPSPG